MKYLRITGLIITGIILLILSYYTIVTVSARNYTRDIIKNTVITKEYPITINDFKKRQIDILLAVQDPGFYSHHGIDLSTPGAGLTTLTQAVVKKIYFKRFKPGIAKIKQSLFAYFALDPIISKEDQFTLFVNLMYFGKINNKTVVGFADASLLFYGKSFENLTEDEYISLVAVIVSPNTFNPYYHPEWNRERVERIKLLVNNKYKPKGLMDQYYGKLSKDIIKSGIPPFSYFKSMYED